MKLVIGLVRLKGEMVGEEWVMVENGCSVVEREDGGGPMAVGRASQTADKE